MTSATVNRISVVRRLVRIESHGDDVDLAHVVAIGPTLGKLGDGSPRVIAGGATDMNPNDAAVRAVGECIERFSAAVVPQEKLTRGAAASVGADERLIRDLIGYSDEQYAQDEFPFAPFSPKADYAWVRASRVESKELDGGLVVPAQLVYLEANSSLDEPLLDTRLSVGLAAGQTVDGATAAGLIEAVERHVASDAWHRQQLTSKLVTETMGPAVQDLCRRWSEKGVEATLIVLPCKWRIAVVAAVLIDQTDHGPYATFGLGAGFDWDRIALKALYEASMVRHSCRRMTPTSNFRGTRSTGSKVLGIRDRARYYADPATREVIESTMGGPRTIRRSELPDLGGFTWKGLAQELSADGMPAYRFVLTPPEISAEGFEVVRVMVPGLRPMDVIHNAPHLRGRQSLGSYPLEPHPFS